MSDIQNINSTNSPYFKQDLYAAFQKPIKIESNTATLKQQNQDKQNTDKFEFQNESNLPNISKKRIFFKKFTNQEVEAINNAGIMPKNLCIVQAPDGSLLIKSNYNGKRNGTRIIPKDYELKNDKRGHTKLVLKGTQGSKYYTAEEQAKIDEKKQIKTQKERKKELDKINKKLEKYEKKNKPLTEKQQKDYDVLTIQKNALQTLIDENVPYYTVIYT